ncbi:MAG TPA: DUF2017 family protein [Gaiellaceae bacterium]
MGDDAAGRVALAFVPPIQAVGRGEYRVSLADAERELLRMLPAELRTLLGTDPDDRSLRRLFPPAYEEDDAEAEYRRLMGAELLDGRREALRILEETAGNDRLTQEELDAWLAALNDLRLVLGTRLDVTEETYDREVDPRDPRAYEHSVYLYLSWLQEHAVAAAARDL